MMRRFLFSIIALVLIASLSCAVFAAEPPKMENTQVITYADGSCLVITTGTDASPRSSVGFRTGTKTLQYKDSTGAVLWKAVLSVIFTYTGSTSACQSANCAVTIYDSGWSVLSKVTSTNGNTAITNLSMGYTPVGGPTIPYSYTIRLTCDENGNIS